MRAKSKSSSKVDLPGADATLTGTGAGAVASKAPGAPAPNARSAPAPKAGGDAVSNPASDATIADFISKIKTLTPSVNEGRGRLIFVMDATMSRQPTWDMALTLQSSMFTAVKDVGGLDVQLMFFRGLNECKASRWVSDPDQLATLMRGVRCQGGLTQLGRTLGAARDEAIAKKVNALVYVGDAMEENIDQVCARAGELALLGVPVFLFQEGHDPRASIAFKEIARLTRGAACRFDAGSAQQLKDLLTAVAVYAAGGHKALLALSQRSGSAGARLLLSEMRSAGQK